MSPSSSTPSKKCWPNRQFAFCSSLFSSKDLPCFRNKLEVVTTFGPSSIPCYLTRMNDQLSFASLDVPQGHLIIARQFTAGDIAVLPQVPEGRQNLFLKSEISNLKSFPFTGPAFAPLRETSVYLAWPSSVFICVYPWLKSPMHRWEKSAEPSQRQRPSSYFNPFQSKCVIKKYQKTVPLNRLISHHQLSVSISLPRRSLAKAGIYSPSEVALPRRMGPWLKSRVSVEATPKSNTEKRKSVVFPSHFCRGYGELLRTFARCCEPFPGKKLSTTKSPRSKTLWRISRFVNLLPSQALKTNSNRIQTNSGQKMNRLSFVSLLFTFAYLVYFVVT